MTASSDEVKRLLDFDSVDDTALFSPVDDAVMGGMSSSRLAPAGRGIAAFEGNVSLENGGGFASVRSRPQDWDTAGATALRGASTSRSSSGSRGTSRLRRARHMANAPSGSRSAQMMAPAQPSSGSWGTMALSLPTHFHG